MKTFFCSFGLLMAAVPVFAQNTGKDSIVSTKALDDIEANPIRCGFSDSSAC